MCQQSSSSIASIISYLPKDCASSDLATLLGDEAALLGVLGCLVVTAIVQSRFVWYDVEDEMSEAVEVYAQEEGRCVEGLVLDIGAN